MARKYEKEIHRPRNTSRQHKNSLSDKHEVKISRKRSPAPSRHQQEKQEKKPAKIIEVVRPRQQ